jgi:Zn-dependent protease with chaperone function
MSHGFSGILFDGETLAGRSVNLTVTEGYLHDLEQPDFKVVPLAEVRTSDRLARVPRYLYLSDGRTIETPDNDAVDALLAGQRRGRLIALIHALEIRHQVAAAATLLLAISVAITVWWGLPVLARRAAMAAPSLIEQQAGRAALATIKQILPQTQLDRAERDRVTALTKRLSKAAGLAEPPEVVFRSMGGQSPNAFALPGGIIVVSDELVRLTTIDDEIAAVLAHEIGHGQHRHGLQGVLRSSSALLLVSTVTGDLSTLTSFASTLPFLLLQRGYSREFETEADDYAVELMRRAGIDAHHFESILKKLEEARPKEGTDFTYLSTHPNTAARIKRINPLGLPKPASDADANTADTSSVMPESQATSPGPDANHSSD